MRLTIPHVKPYVYLKAATAGCLKALKTDLLLNADTAQIEDVNPYLINMLGYTHEEFLGKKLWEVGPFADIAQSKEMFVELQTDGYVRYDDLPLKQKLAHESRLNLSAILTIAKASRSFSAISAI